MKPLTVFTPDQVTAQVNPAPLSDFDLQFLAQGDSWFSLGALPPHVTSNLFDGMGTTRIAGCVVNCAYPGQELRLMTDTTNDQKFLNLLTGRAARQWIGILLSGGGNDLIAALQQPPTNAPALRLLATKDEWTNAPGGERYLSNAGWATFATHLTAVIGNFLAVRDRGINRGVPVVMHTYDLATPRNAPAGLGVGPWLYPAVNAFGIPEADWPGVARALLMRLEVLLDHIAATTPDGSLHVVDSQGTLHAALTTDTGPTADWENEIHPTMAGYRQLSALWTPVLDAVFASRIQPPAG